MEIVDVFRNYINSLVGRNQEFEQLLKNKDISAARECMTSRRAEAMEALKEYNVFTHEIMKRQDKIITDKKGNFVRKEPVWKLPIPYPTYINEIALVFMFGQPVKWLQDSEGTDRAFQAYINLIKKTRFNAKLRQCKRLAGAETESAMLFRVFKDSEGRPDVQIRVLAHSKGDEIYTRWDNFENLLSVAWGYYAKESESSVVYHLEVYTPHTIYHCAKKSLGWEVVEEPNLIGKIPVILFRQSKEWAGVEHLIHREEFIASRTADTNDYFADPIAIMSAEVIKNMPEKKEAAKMLITNTADGVDKAAKYLTWDSAPQSKKDEIEWLQDQILSKTFTPNITLDTLKSMSNMSGKALRIVMLLADIKASKNKELYDELLDRTASLITAIIGNVLDVSLAAECKNLVISHEYQEPFGDDISETLDNIGKAIDAGILTTETALELNPLVKDPLRELERIKGEEEESRKRQEAIFGNPEDMGAQSADTDDEEDEDDDEDGVDENGKNRPQGASKGKK